MKFLDRSIKENQLTLALQESESKPCYERSCERDICDKKWRYAELASATDQILGVLYKPVIVYLYYSDISQVLQTYKKQTKKDRDQLCYFLKGEPDNESSDSPNPQLCR